MSENWDTYFSRAITHLYQQTADHLSKGDHVILDFGFWDRQSRDYARKVARQHGATLTHVYLDSPDELAMAKIKNHIGKIAAYNLENFQELKKAFQIPEDDENVIVIKPDLT